MTLLALGNGAPDVLASISAAGSEGGGMFFSVGALIGSGLFVTGVVSAVVIISSPKPIKVPGINLIRDIAFYLLALVVLITAAIIGELNVWFAIAFFVIYFTYVVTVVIMDKLEDKAKHGNASAALRATFRVTGAGGDAYFYTDEDDHLVDIEVEDGLGNTNKFGQFLSVTTANNRINGSVDTDSSRQLSLGTDENGKSYGINADSNMAKTMSKPMVPKMDELVEKKGDQSPANGSSSSIDPELKDKVGKAKIDKEKDLSKLVVDEHFEEHEALKYSNKDAIEEKGSARKRAHRTKHKIVWSMLKMKKFMKNGIRGEQSFKEMGIISKILYIMIDAPLDFVRRLTIPPPDGEAWDRRIAAVMPFFCIFFIYVVTGFIDFTEVPHFSFWILQGVALIISIVICFTTPLNHGPRRTMVIFSVFSFILSIVWIWFIANILIDLIAVLGLILGLKQAFLGITLLAWGNSVGDIMANSAFAKKGLATMALTASFAAPLFDFLMGLGLSLVVKKINGDPPDSFRIKDEEARLPLMAIGGLFLQFLMIITISAFFKFNLRKPQGFIQIGYFVCVIVAITVAAFTFAS